MSLIAPHKLLSSVPAEALAIGILVSTAEGKRALLERMTNWATPWATHFKWIESTTYRWYAWPLLPDLFPAPAWITDDAAMEAVPAIRLFMQHMHEAQLQRHQEANNND